MTELPERIREVQIDSFGDYAGTLSQPAQFSFTYDAGAQRQCSLTMPIRPAPYQHGSPHPIQSV